MFKISLAHVFASREVSNSEKEDCLQTRPIPVQVSGMDPGLFQSAFFPIGI